MTLQDLRGCAYDQYLYNMGAAQSGYYGDFIKAYVSNLSNTTAMGSGLYGSSLANTTFGYPQLACFAKRDYDWAEIFKLNPRILER